MFNTTRSGTFACGAYLGLETTCGERPILGVVKSVCEEKASRTQLAPMAAVPASIPTINSISSVRRLLAIVEYSRRRCTTIPDVARVAVPGVSECRSPAMAYFSRLTDIRKFRFSFRAELNPAKGA